MVTRPLADLETDEQLDVAWRRGAPVREGEALHLVVAWWLDEPERTGQVGSLARASWLGRGEAQAGEGEPLALCFQRPGKLECAPPIGSTKISRRQLRFRPAPGEAVAVECVGRRRLLHNGREVGACVVRTGDTLTLEDAVVFLVESRPEALPGLRAYRGPFPFGQADPHGIVGETPAAWRLRASAPLRDASEGEVSYLAALPSRDVVVAGNQQVTRDWWARRSRFELFVSDAVLEEARRGDGDAARRRLGFLDGVPVLAIHPDAERLAGSFLSAAALPSKTMPFTLPFPPSTAWTFS
jgi:hypothetical protein